MVGIVELSGEKSWDFYLDENSPYFALGATWSFVNYWMFVFQILMNASISECVNMNVATRGDHISVSARLATNWQQMTAPATVSDCGVCRLLQRKGFREGNTSLLYTGLMATRALTLRVHLLGQNLKKIT